MQLEAGFNIDRNNPQNTSESWQPTARDGPFASTKGTVSPGCSRLKNANGERLREKNGEIGERKEEKEDERKKEERNENCRRRKKKKKKKKEQVPKMRDDGRREVSCAT